MGGRGGGGLAPNGDGSYLNDGYGVSGFVNTGGGGGGGGTGWNSTFAASPGGAGGSGIVIISYPVEYAPASSTTGSPTVTTTGANTVMKFTTSGTYTA